jgi:hypothetical protein
MPGGAAVCDLEPFLGAPGHMLIVNADLTEAVTYIEEPATRGPVITFQPLMPAASTYKLWLQFSVTAPSLRFRSALSVWETYDVRFCRVLQGSSGFCRFYKVPSGFCMFVRGSNVGRTRELKNPVIPNEPCRTPNEPVELVEPSEPCKNLLREAQLNRALAALLIRSASTSEIERLRNQ